MGGQGVGWEEGTMGGCSAGGQVGRMGSRMGGCSECPEFLWQLSSLLVYQPSGKADDSRQYVSPVMQSLERAQASLADAVLILANKTPQDLFEEDLQNMMTLVSLGQYIQCDVRRRSSKAPRPLAYRLATRATSLLRWLQPVRS
jgi:hypothetical protein